MVGRNVLDGRWTFQIVEEFGDNYWTVCREYERHLRNTFPGGEQDTKDAPPSEPDCGTDRREMAPGSVDIYGHRGTGRPG